MPWGGTGVALPVWGDWKWFLREELWQFFESNEILKTCVTIQQRIHKKKHLSAHFNCVICEIYIKNKQNKKRVKYLRQEDFKFKANLNCIARACHEIFNKNKLSWESVSLRWQPLSMKLPTRSPHANTELQAGAYIIQFLSDQLSHHAFVFSQDACMCVWWERGKSLRWSSKSLSHFRLLAGKKS